MLARDKHSNLLQKSVNYGCKKGFIVQALGYVVFPDCYNMWQSKTAAATKDFPTFAWRQIFWTAETCLRSNGEPLLGSFWDGLPSFSRWTPKLATPKSLGMSRRSCGCWNTRSGQLCFFGLGMKWQLVNAHNGARSLTRWCYPSQA